MSKIIRETVSSTTVDIEGNIIAEQKNETTRTIGRNNEPDYIKLYTRMWCEFNQIPEVYRELFLQLIMRMSYCNSSDLGNSQTVYTGKPIADSIMQVLGWKKRMYQRGLAALCACGAIRRLARGVYQINPSYAGKGEWCYNPRLDRGGVEDLVATFDFKNGTVDTKIVWGDDGSTANMNTVMREGMNVNADDRTVLKSSSKVIPGQMTVFDYDDTSDIDKAFGGVAK